MFPSFIVLKFLCQSPSCAQAGELGMPSVWLCSNLRNSGHFSSVYFSRFQGHNCPSLPDTSFPSFNLVPICCPMNYRPFDPLRDHRNQSFNLGMVVYPCNSCTGKAKEEGLKLETRVGYEARLCRERESQHFSKTLFLFIPIRTDFISEEVRVIRKAEGPELLSNYCHATIRSSSLPRHP